MSAARDQDSSSPTKSSCSATQKNSLRVEPMHDEKLCEICSGIDFINSLRTLCLDCRALVVGKLASLGGRDSPGPMGKISPHVLEGASLGTLGRLEKSKDCPACRLILSCINSYYGRKIPPRTSRITLKQSIRVFGWSEEMQARSRQNDHSPASIMTSLVITVHGQAINTAKRRGTGDEVGAIISLPFDEKVTETWVTAEQAPFSTVRPERDFKILPRQTKEFIDIELIQKWFQRCREHHGNTCGRNMLPQPAQTIRLIDVAELKVVRGNLDMEFVALSYVWGANAEPLLKKSTEHPMSAVGGICIDRLPRTIGDAIEFTRKLGQRFIWIDSACIIQDDDMDKREQLPLMDRIYSCAELVIIAAGGDSAHSGLPGLETQRSIKNRPVELIKGFPFTTILPQLSEHLDSSVWNTRGWTFQEALVARRILVVVDDQAHWICRTTSWIEDTFTEFDNMHPRLDYKNSVFTQNLGRSCYNTLVQVDECHLMDYVGKVERFTSRRFTDETDTFWAFQGVLKLLQPSFPSGYIWGIPRNALDAMLLWEVDCDFRSSSAVHKIYEHGKGVRVMLFPSWSWLAKGCNLHYNTCGEWTESKVIWHDPIPYGDDDQIPCHCTRCSESFSTPAILLDEEHQMPESGQNISDFGLLQFDGAVAAITLRFITLLSRPHYCDHKGTNFALAQMELSDKTCIGFVKVNFGLFWQKNTESNQYPQILEACQVEIVHLSTNRVAIYSETNQPLYCTEDDSQEDGTDAWHAPGCRYAENVNLMVIRWDKDYKIAYRLGLARVQESDWEKVETKVRRIILG